jgi:phospholipid/cholesterol/gamma-HCH transport system permease protein
MINGADFVDEELPNGDRVLRFTGALSIAGIGKMDRRLRVLPDGIKTIDLSEVEEIDTVGAWLVYRTARDHDAAVIGANKEARKLIEEVGVVDTVEPHVREKRPFLDKTLGAVGRMVIDGGRGLIEFLSFVGQTIKAFFSILIHPRRFRLTSVVEHFDRVGVQALPIIGLMSFLIGIVIAQQGAVQLQQFGAEVFTVNLIGRITFRELGILMTAIMVAGRSGSAFAAQIGTMKITEEVDAMRTIGVVPNEALVVPRVLAAVIMMPLLGIYASLIAVIGGGLLCWAVLEIPPITFIARLREVTPITDFYVGLIKAPVFGAIIAISGCFQGMRVSGNAEQVGRKTTAAVVQAIFLVIVLDAFFAVFFSSIGWD